jgi:hypothetical protein
MTERGFRILLVAHIVTLLLGTIAGTAFPQLLPSSLIEAYQAAGSESLLERPWIWAVVIPLAVAVLAGYLGLFLWRAWGRTLSLASTLAGLALYPLMGASVASWAESSLLDASSILWGAVLALAYFGPVSSRFQTGGPSRAGALHGPA